jgi:glycosyltransferase involved in cell wall biosynthesis
MAQDKPVLFVTGHAPPDRVGAFRALHEREGIELALFGGRSLHGTSDKLGATGSPTPVIPSGALPSGALPILPIPNRSVRQHELFALAASGKYRAVVISTGGRVAPLAAWAGARRAGVPVILWASLWAHPRTAAHAFSYAALRRLYRNADAVVTYGPHVSAYVRARGAHNVHVAPQAVDNDFWSANVIGRDATIDQDPTIGHDATIDRDPTIGHDATIDQDPTIDRDATIGHDAAGAPPHAAGWPRQADFILMFGGRPAREKGLRVLIEAWLMSGLAAPAAALVLVGVGSHPPWIPAGGAVALARKGPVASARKGAAGEGAVALARKGIICFDPVDAVAMRNFYAASDVLVLPSIATRRFREPWGLVVNEAMNRKLPVIVSDAVGAAAGGLVRNEHNGLVVPAGDAQALADAITRLAADRALAQRLGEAGAQDVRAYSYTAWAQGFSAALASVGASMRVSESTGSVRHEISQGKR